MSEPAQVSNTNRPSNSSSNSNSSNINSNSSSSNSNSNSNAKPNNTKKNTGNTPSNTKTNTVNTRTNTGNTKTNTTGNTSGNTKTNTTGNTSGNTKTNTGNTRTNTGNTKSNTGNSSSNNKTNTGNTRTNTGNTRTNTGNTRTNTGNTSGNTKTNTGNTETKNESSSGFLSGLFSTNTKTSQNGNQNTKNDNQNTKNNKNNNAKNGNQNTKNGNEKNNVNKSLANKISNTVEGLTDTVKETASSVGETIKERASDLKELATPDDDSSILYDIFKVVLFILVLVVLFYVAKYLFNKYRDSVYSSPYLLEGTKNAKHALYISQDPANDGHIPIANSENRDGVEFTYDFWMLVESYEYKNGDWKHVFHKGNSTSYPNRAPGVWLHPTQNIMRVYMNTQMNILEYVDIENMPLRKWIHVSIVLHNKNLDVFINGYLKKRKELTSMPKLNNSDFWCNMFGGYEGFISRLRYYSHALKQEEIEHNVRKGPSANACIATGEIPPYLDDDWWYN
jgi:hypothetical protein